MTNANPLLRIRVLAILFFVQAVVVIGLVGSLLGWYLSLVVGPLVGCGTSATLLALWWLRREAMSSSGFRW